VEDLLGEAIEAKASPLRNPQRNGRMAGRQQLVDQLGRSEVDRVVWVVATLGDVGFGHESAFGREPDEGFLPLAVLWSSRARPLVRVTASSAESCSVRRAQD